jgi:hypothetical protein
MHLVRIDLPKGKSPDQRRAIADVLYEAMREHMNVSENDCFQILVEHSENELIVDPSYLSIARS